MIDPMLTYNDEVEQLIGPCPRCGKFVKWTEDEAKDMVDRDNRMVLDPDMKRLRDMINGMGYYCASCDFALRSLDNADVRKHQISHLTHKTYSKGLIQESGKEQTFDKSDLAIEGENMDEWKQAREATPITGTYWIHGPSGVGKTFLARCMLNDYLDRYRTAIEVSASDLAYIDLIGSESRLKPYLDANILLIDDIDKPKWNSVGLDYLLKIFEVRYEKKRGTIVTANTGAKAARVLMRQAREDNPSIVNAIFDRMKPLQGLELKGSSHR